jgi:hypothetical protein
VRSSAAEIWRALLRTRYTRREKKVGAPALRNELRRLDIRRRGSAAQDRELSHREIVPGELPPENLKERRFEQRRTEQQGEVVEVEARVVLPIHLLGMTRQLVHLALEGHECGAKA